MVIPDEPALQTFSRFYNKRHGRRGIFWGDRFKSLIVEQGEILINRLPIST